MIPNLRRRYDEGSWAVQEDLEPYRTLRDVPDVPRPAAEAGEPGGARQGPRHRRLREPADQRSARGVRCLRAHRARSADRRRACCARFASACGFCTTSASAISRSNRSAATLSGGEGQRIRLATQIGANLTGVLYVLDEPSIGLHQRDNRKLLATLARLRDLGNTVVVVEHDEETIRTADYVVDLGPGAGEHGGRRDLPGNARRAARRTGARSLTGAICAASGRFRRRRRGGRRSKGEIVIRGARANNLKNIDVTIPARHADGGHRRQRLGQVDARQRHPLSLAGARRSTRPATEPGAHDRIDGIDLIDKVIEIDQSPIGRTPRSNPATYTGMFTFIRELFAMMPEAKARGFKPGRFSFNVKGGRCEACQGDGVIAIEMHFLPDVYVTCEQCKGRRYNRETLEIQYRGKSIAEVLDLTVDQALPLLENFPPIANKLRTLQDVGLGYIELGQSATTLSGGEAQRVKLSRELSRRSTGRTLYILDEPTTGLHFEDTRKLLDVLNRLVDQGNTVVVIEHNLDVIRCADYLIDLGPEGGVGGGRVIAAGTPEEVAAQRQIGDRARFLNRSLAPPRRPASASRALTAVVVLTTL